MSALPAPLLAAFLAGVISLLPLPGLVAPLLPFILTSLLLLLVAPLLVAPLILLAARAALLRLRGSGLFALFGSSVLGAGLLSRLLARFGFGGFRL